MASLWKSFVEAMAPPKQGEQVQGEGVTLNCTVGGHPLSHMSHKVAMLGSQAPKLLWNTERSEQTLMWIQPEKTEMPGWKGVDGESDVEFQDSREVLHPGTLADSITVPRSVPTTSMTI